MSLHFYPKEATTEQYRHLLHLGLLLLKAALLAIVELLRLLFHLPMVT
jgi:hypothetical protein